MYDNRDRIESMKDPYGNTTSFGYDQAGRRITVTTPRGTTTYAYDAEGRVLSVTDPLGGRTKTSYSPAGDVLTRNRCARVRHALRVRPQRTGGEDDRCRRRSYTRCEAANAVGLLVFGLMIIAIWNGMFGSTFMKAQAVVSMKYMMVAMANLMGVGFTLLGGAKLSKDINRPYAVRLAECNAQG